MVHHGLVRIISGEPSNWDKFHHVLRISSSQRWHVESHISLQGFRVSSAEELLEQLDAPSWAVAAEKPWFMILGYTDILSFFHTHYWYC